MPARTRTDNIVLLVIAHHQRMLGGNEFTVERQHIQIARGLANLFLAGDDHVVKHAGESRHFQLGTGIAGLRVAEQRHDNAGFLQFSIISSAPGYRRIMLVLP
mgnify:CR=1 FL=1